MGEEPTATELLLGFAAAAAVVVVIGLAVILAVVGMTMWVRASLRRRAAGQPLPTEPAPTSSP